MEWVGNLKSHLQSYVSVNAAQNPISIGATQNPPSEENGDQVEHANILDPVTVRGKRRPLSKK